MRINATGLEVKIQELNRDIATQRKYVEEGKSKTLNSRHLDRLAADIVLFRDGVPQFDGETYRPFGVYWESLGGIWGGRFGVKPVDYGTKVGWDPVHFEFTP
jgi:hypothetical protein